MLDESRSEARPIDGADALPSSPQVEPLRREVEPPRTAAGLWLPFMALASAAMLTITSGIAVMTRAPRVRIDGPETMLPAAPPARPQAEMQTLERDVGEIIRQQRELDAAAGAPANTRRVLCRVAVQRGNLDGDTQPYEECIVSPDIAAPASTIPQVR